MADDGEDAARRDDARELGALAPFRVFLLQRSRLHAVQGEDVGQRLSLQRGGPVLSQQLLTHMAAKQKPHSLTLGWDDEEGIVLAFD